jgi:hypothetical protein
MRHADAPLASLSLLPGFNCLRKIPLHQVFGSAQGRLLHGSAIWCRRGWTHMLLLLSRATARRGQAQNGVKDAGTLAPVWIASVIRDEISKPVPVFGRRIIEQKRRHQQGVARPNGIGQGQAMQRPATDISASRSLQVVFVNQHVDDEGMQQLGAKLNPHRAPEFRPLCSVKCLI